jgi:hypothetical protein
MIDITPWIPIHRSTSDPRDSPHWTFYTLQDHGLDNVLFSCLVAERPRGIGACSCESRNRDDSQDCCNSVLYRRHLKPRRPQGKRFRRNFGGQQIPVRTMPIQLHPLRHRPANTFSIYHYADASASRTDRQTAGDITSGSAAWQRCRKNPKEYVSGHRIHFEAK